MQGASNGDLIVLEETAICVERHCRRLMSERELDALHIGAYRDGKARRRVAEVVWCPPPERERRTESPGVYGRLT